MPETREIAKLPNGQDFVASNENILQSCLAICDSANSDRVTIKRAIAEKHFGDSNHAAAQASNCLNGMRAYKLIEKDCSLSDVGRTLLEIEDYQERIDAFAVHLLETCYGLQFIWALQDVNDCQIDESGPKKAKIARCLGERYGIITPENGKAVQDIKGWLEAAGIITRDFQINENTLSKLLTDYDDMDKLRKLPTQQRFFMRALLDMHAENPSGHKNHAGYFDSAGVRRVAHSRYGIRFDSSELPTTVLNPLKEAGLVECEYHSATGNEKSHGGGRNYIKPTRDIVIKDLDKFFAILDYEDLDDNTRQAILKPYSEILAMCESDNVDEKGRGLELLAFKLLKSAGLTPISIRKRDIAIGNAEVDLLFEDVRTSYSLWQVQCKNARNPIGSEVIAREVGISSVLKSNVILIIATNGFTSDARKFSRSVNQNSNLAVILISGEELNKMKAGKMSSFETLMAKSEETRFTKSSGSFTYGVAKGQFEGFC